VDTDVDELQQLTDPELMLRVTAARSRLAYTPAGKPGHADVKAGYDRLRDEYRRRMDEARHCADRATA
jgi:hypothetical protein